jgi:polyribonucleotide nucleotidyltransferase
VKEVKDELREGDQILVKVLSIEGNRIKLSRKAVLREQRAKLGLPEVAPEPSAYGTPIERPMPSVQASDDSDGDDEGEEIDGEDEDSVDEPNFNRAEVPVGAPGVPVARTAGGPGGDRRPGGGDRRRRRGGRRPGGSGGGAPQGGGGNR